MTKKEISTLAGAADARSRHGSALIMVLGILSVMMLMAVAFSVFVRTERAGATNLKNSFVARQSLQTALTHVMDGIDMSFNSAITNTPVETWPNPFLTSSDSITNDFLDSSILKKDEVSKARVLTPEIARFLTPAQLALVRSARIGWAPIYSGIKTSAIQTTCGGGLYGNIKRPNTDSLIGRYAFIALDTTGLLDMNKTGYDQSADARAETCGEDPSAWIIVNGQDNASLNKETPTQLVNGNNVLKARKKNGTFFSFADLREMCSNVAIEEHGDSVGSNPGLDLSYPGGKKKRSDVAVDKYYPADIFNTFTTSLEELTPEGEAKIILPTKQDMGNDNFRRVFAKRALRAMAAIFARSKAECSGNPAKASDANMDAAYRIYGGTASFYSLSRARLATVAMVDAMDEDFESGTWDTMNMWTTLDKSVSGIKLRGIGAVGEVKDEIGGSRSSNNLDYPVTEPVPMLSRVFVNMKWTDRLADYTSVPSDSSSIYYRNDDGTLVKPKAKTPGLEWYKDIAVNTQDFWSHLVVVSKGEISAGAVVAAQNLSTNSMSGTCSVTVDWDILPASSSSYACAYPDGRNIAEKMEGGYLSWWGKGTNKKIFWCKDAKPSETFFEENSAGPHRCTSFSGSGNIDTSKGQGSVLLAKGKEPFNVISFKRDFDAPTPVYRTNADGNPEFDHWGNIDFFHPVAVEDSAFDAPTVDGVYLPVRMKATVKFKGKTVQQVPGPALDGSDNRYWLRCDLNAYKKDSPKQEKLDWGWAYCLCPTFGFDTSCLMMKGNMGEEDLYFLSQPTISSASGQTGASSVKAWVNDAIARQHADNIKAYKKMVNNLIDDENRHLQDDDLTSRNNMNYAQRELLLDGLGKNDFDENSVAGELIVNHFLGGVATRPDLLHSWSTNSSGSRLAPPNNIGTAHVFTRISNVPFLTPADLGNVMCGPYETLSLFRTWREDTIRGGASDAGGDFHRVMDYFTTTDNRYPLEKNLKVGSSGELTAQNNGLLFPAIHNGRININPQSLVSYDHKDPFRVAKRSDNDPVNFWPLATLINGVCYNDVASGGRTINSSRDAADLAYAMSETFANSGVRHKNNRFNSSRYLNSYISDVGAAIEDDKVNAFLKAVVTTLKGEENQALRYDYEREGVLRGISNGLTTRGQTYLVIIRADAYTPKFGEEGETNDGTTLATTHALVELWRDPEPARLVNGDLPRDKNNNPIAFHNWYIRSYRVF